MTNDMNTTAQVLPFAGAALRRQSEHRAAVAVAAANSSALEQALLRIAESDSRSTEICENRLLGLLLDALANQRFEAHFQPQHCLRTGAVLGAEALLRLADAQGRYLNTQALIDVAESHDLMGLIGRQMMDKACAGYAQLKHAGCVSGRLALNVSLLELRHPGYSDALLGSIAEHGLRPEDVELELTESQPLDLPGVHLSQLLDLQAAGVDLAIDDFGSGYATWSSLACLPIRSVKLDRSAVTPVLHCERTAAMITHLVRCGSEMQFRVIAEGVQSAAQQDRLVELGCTVGQGFSLSVPASVSGLLGTDQA
ncbi:MAG: EAL domain-containing protein [Pseudomonadales bacterium]